MTSEERTTSLHLRMDALRKKQIQWKAAAIGTGCILLVVCLVVLVGGGGKDISCGRTTLYIGATMMFENAGGYVAVAIAFFMAGVVITAVILKKRYRLSDSKHDSLSANQKGTEK